jgi:hypothetical protein
VFRKTFPVGDSGFLCLARSFSTVDFAISMPNLRSSPTIRGEPQVGFACHVL